MGWARGLTVNEEEILRMAMEILHRRSGPVAPSLTLRQLYGHYKPYRAKLGGWRVVQFRLSLVLDAVYAEGTATLGDREVMSLRVLDWSDWRNWRAAKEYAPGKTPKDHTVNLHLESLKAMLNWGVREGRIPHNPLTQARPVGKRGKRNTAPTEADIAAMLAVSDDIERYIVLAGSDAGMRRTEWRLCRHEWVDCERGQISLGAEVCKGKKARTVPATKRLLDAIAALPRHFRIGCILSNPDTGEPFADGTVARWFRELEVRSGVEAAPGDRRVVAHDLRHHFASASAERNIPVPVIQKQMGHKHIATTMLYVQTRDSATYGPALDAFEAGIAAELEKTRQDKSAPEKGKR
jgi:integrase